MPRKKIVAQATVPKAAPSGRKKKKTARSTTGTAQARPRRTSAAESVPAPKAVLPPPDSRGVYRFGPIVPGVGGFGRPTRDPERAARLMAKHAAIERLRG